MNARTTKIGPIIVGGCGHLGSRIARELCERGYAVVVIERDPIRGASEGSDPRAGYRVIRGDICDDAVLRQAGIDSAHCLLAVTGDDRTNLEAAIAARQLAPDIHAVIRLDDQTIAQSIEHAFGVQVLSASFLALPACFAAATDGAFAAACEVAGRQLNFGRHDASSPHSKVVVSMSGDRIILCDRGSHGTATCFSVTLGELGTPFVGKQRQRLRMAHPPLRAWAASLHPKACVHTVRALWHHMSLITRRLLAALGVVVVVSMVLFATMGGMSPLDALYFVVTTLTTVGYGDINLLAAPPLLKAYGIVMMLCGAALLATLYAIISDFVLTARIEYLLGRRAVTVTDHTIVVGLGKVGYRVARALHALGFTIVAVEANDDTDQVTAARLVMPVIVGNAARTSVLLKAGVERARTILALTDDPMLNLSVVLHAREHNPHIRAIVRTYDNRFAERLQDFGLDATISTSAIAAPVFADAAIHQRVEGSFSLDGEKILVVRHAVSSTSPFCGKEAGMTSERLGIAPVLVFREGESEPELAAPQTILREGDTAIVLGTHGNVAVLEHAAVG